MRFVGMDPDDNEYRWVLAGAAMLTQAFFFFFFRCFFAIADCSRASLWLDVGFSEGFRGVS